MLPEGVGPGRAWDSLSLNSPVSCRGSVITPILTPCVSGSHWLSKAGGGAVLPPIQSHMQRGDLRDWNPDRPRARPPPWPPIRTPGCSWVCDPTHRAASPALTRTPGHAQHGINSPGQAANTHGEVRTHGSPGNGWPLTAEDRVPALYTGGWDAVHGPQHMCSGERGWESQRRPLNAQKEGLRPTHTFAVPG